MFKKLCEEESCRKPIIMIQQIENGEKRWHPYIKDENGKLISHFKDCTNPDRFKQTT